MNYMFKFLSESIKRYNKISQNLITDELTFSVILEATEIIETYVPQVRGSKSLYKRITTPSGFFVFNGLLSDFNAGFRFIFL